MKVTAENSTDHLPATVAKLEPGPGFVQKPAIERLILRQFRRIGVRALSCGLLLGVSASATFAQNAPSISTPPQSQSVTVGANASFSVTASGGGPLTFEWWNEFGPLYPAQTNATFSLADVGFADAGSYKVLVRNSAGSVTSAEAVLIVNPGGGFTTGDNFLWARKAGGTGFEPGGTVAGDTAGNICVVGSFTGSATFGGVTLNSGGRDIFVVKYDRAGGVLWARKAGGSGEDVGAGVAVDRAGNIHVTGSFSGSATFGGVTLNSGGGRDVFVAKYDRAGNLLWVRRAGGVSADEGHRVTADLAGNSYVVGTFAGTATFGGATLTSSGASDGFIAKYSVAGTPLWAKRVGGSGQDRGTSLAVDGQGDTYVAGHFQGTADFGGTNLTADGNDASFLAAFNSSGAVRWAAKASGLDPEVDAAIAVDLDGQCYLSGSFAGTATIGNTTLASRAAHDLLLARFTRDGALHWAGRIGALAGETAGVGLYAGDTATVGALLSGNADFSGGAGGGVDLFAAQYNLSGQLVWGKQAGASFADFALAVLVDDRGNRNLIGYFEESADVTNPDNSGVYDLFFAQLDRSSAAPPPFITTQPSGQMVLVGHGLTLGVSASGLEPLSYQWRFNGVDLDGETSSTLTRQNLQLGDEGRYEVVVGNTNGATISAPAVLSVQNPPSDTTPPTVALASPAANARVTNSPISLRGSASDNVAVDRVEYSLNGGAFLPAGGTTNWSAALALMPGTNSVRVKSLDLAGNESAEAVRALVYVPLSPFTLTVSGRGTVTPELGGQLLEIGKIYTLTARPAPRFLFTGWTGDLVSNGPQFTFIMQPGLALQANFITNSSPLPDAIAPTVAIRSPGTNAWITNASMTVRGVARDNVEVARVEYQLGTNEFQAVSGTTNWSADLVLAPGTNLFRVRSVDGSNNVSAVASRKFVYTQLSPLQLTIVGEGTVTPPMTGQNLVIGRQYTLTAMPAPGQVFSNWLGGLTTNAAKIKFVMQPDLALLVNFVPNPFPAIRGSYNGLFHEADGVRHESSGFLTLALTTHGRYTGTLLGGGRRLSFEGKFDLAGRATNLVARPGTNTLTVEWQLGLGAGAGQLTGRVVDVSWAAPLLADRAVFHSVSNISPFAGHYTLVIPGTNDPAMGPGGTGYGTASVGLGGKVTLNATLGDGTPAMQVVPLSQAGVWPLYVPLYGGKGSAMGWLTFTNRQDDDFTGRLSWIRPTFPERPRYPAGFTNETVVVGSSYLPPTARTNRVIGLTNGVVELSGGNLLADFANSVVLTETNKVINLSSNRLNLTLSLPTGLFQGTAFHPTTGQPVPFKGAILQKQNSGAGFFAGTNQTGRVYWGP